MVIFIAINTGIQIHTQDEADCISHSTNTLEKSMNPIILVGQTGVYSFD